FELAILETAGPHKGNMATRGACPPATPHSNVAWLRILGRYLSAVIAPFGCDFRIFRRCAAGLFDNRCGKHSAPRPRLVHAVLLQKRTHGLWLAAAFDHSGGLVHDLGRYPATARLLVE